MFICLVLIFSGWSRYIGELRILRYVLSDVQDIKRLPASVEKLYACNSATACGITPTCLATPLVQSTRECSNLCFSEHVTIQSLIRFRYASSGVYALRGEDASHILTIATQHSVRNSLIMGNIRMFDTITERPYSRESLMLGNSMALRSRPESRFRMCSQPWNMYYFMLTLAEIHLLVFSILDCAFNRWGRPLISPCVALR
jgi:hypothetical protein